MSRTGYVISFAGYPVIWCSRLRTEITLSTTENEYVALSQSLRDMISLISLLHELTPTILFDLDVLKVHCTVHEDNHLCIDLVEGSSYVTPYQAQYH